MPTSTSTSTTTTAGDRLASVATQCFVAPVVRELPRPAPEPPAFASIW